MEDSGEFKTIGATLILEFMSHRLKPIYRQGGAQVECVTVTSPSINSCKVCPPKPTLESWNPPR